MWRDTRGSDDTRYPASSDLTPSVTFSTITVHTHPKIEVTEHVNDIYDHIMTFPHEDKVITVAQTMNTDLETVHSARGLNPENCLASIKGECGRCKEEMASEMVGLPRILSLTLTFSIPEGCRSICPSGHPQPGFNVDCRWDESGLNKPDEWPAQITLKEALRLENFTCHQCDTRPLDEECAKSGSNGYDFGLGERLRSDRGKWMTDRGRMSTKIAESRLFGRNYGDIDAGRTGRPNDERTSRYGHSVGTGRTTVSIGDHVRDHGRGYGGTDAFLETSRFVDNGSSFRDHNRSELEAMGSRFVDDRRSLGSSGRRNDGKVSVGAYQEKHSHLQAMPSMSETYAKTSEDGLAGTHHGGNHPRTGRYDDIPATSSSGDDGRNRAKMQESRRFDKEDRSPDIGETSSKIPKNVRIGRYDWKTLARDVKVEGAAASVVNRGENSTQANAQDRRRIYSGSPTIDIFETGLRVTKNVQSNKDDGKALSRNDKRIGREDRTIGSIRKSSRALSNSQLGEKDDSSKAETDRYDKIDIAVDEDTIRIRTVMLEGGRANRGDGGSASSAKSSPARESRQADRSDDRHVARPSRDGMTGTQAPRDDTGQWNGGRSSQSREAFRYNHVRPQNLSAAIRPPAPDSHIRWPQAAKY